MFQCSNLLIEDYKLQSISVLFVYDLFKQLNLFSQNAGGDDATITDVGVQFQEPKNNYLKLFKTTFYESRIRNLLVIRHI